VSGRPTGPHDSAHGTTHNIATDADLHDAQVSVLFVCLGNICRSPTAQAVFRRKVEEAGLGDRIRIDSAGTGSWHVGQPPDPRAQAAAKRRGLDLSMLRGRQIEPADMERFDYVLVMDRSNLRDVNRLSPGKAELFLTYADGVDVQEVPDPYQEGVDGFERVLDMIEVASEGLLAQIRKRLE